MSTIRIIKTPSSDSRFLEDVIQATNRNTEALGFLPEGVYREAYVSGHLWILADGDSYCGHLLFGGALPKLQIKQLYVVEEMRKHGLARRLIDEIVNYAENVGYTAIRARVAADLDANKVWERLGFTTLDTTFGGQTTGRIINHRYRQLHPRGPQTHMLGIFDAHARASNLVARSMPINRDHWYTLDLNVWLDFARQRKPFYDASRTLIEEASRGQFRLRFTKEAMEEARRTAGDRESDPLLRVAETWQAVPEDEGIEFDSLVNELRQLVFPTSSLSRPDSANNASDVRHLAMSIRAGASGFLTRDNAILSHRRTLWQRYNFQVLTPGELIEPREQRAAPVTMPRAGLTVEPIDKAWSKITDLVKNLRSSGVRLRAVDREDEGWICSVADRQVGFVFWRPVHRGDIEAYLWLQNAQDQSADTCQQVFDVLLGLLTANARSGNVISRLLLQVDGNTSEHYREDLRQIGFFDTREPDRFVRFVSGAPLSLNDWKLAKTTVDNELGVQSHWFRNAKAGPLLRLDKDGRSSQFDRFEFETYFGITGLTLADRNAFYVPIQERFANELLPRPTRPQLFHEHDSSFRVERVYYRNPHQGGKLARGDLLFFYITQTLRHVIGVARCTVSEVLQSAEAKERFRRLAVLDPETIGPQVHCIAFDNYIAFPQPVERKWLNAHRAMPPQNMVTLVPVPASGNPLEIIAQGLRRHA
jgi:GNAT superfamily N-acetyltransferase/predicted nucleic acid-binding protein